MGNKQGGDGGQSGYRLGVSDENAYDSSGPASAADLGRDARLAATESRLAARAPKAKSKDQQKLVSRCLPPPAPMMR